MITPKQIKNARDLAKMTQTELAQAAGFSVEAIRRWEQGGGSPKPENEAKLREILPIGGAGHGESSETDRARE